MYDEELSLMLSFYVSHEITRVTSVFTKRKTLHSNMQLKVLKLKRTKKGLKVRVV